MSVILGSCFGRLARFHRNKIYLAVVLFMEWEINHLKVFLLTSTINFFRKYIFSVGKILLKCLQCRHSLRADRVCRPAGALVCMNSMVRAFARRRDFFEEGFESTTPLAFLPLSWSRSPRDLENFISKNSLSLRDLISRSLEITVSRLSFYFLKANRSE